MSHGFCTDPLIAASVMASYVFFNAAVTARRRTVAANWSGIWYLLSAFSVISYTHDLAHMLVAHVLVAHVLFAVAGSWIGACVSVTFLGRERPPSVDRAGMPPA